MALPLRSSNTLSNRAGELVSKVVLRRVPKQVRSSNDWVVYFILSVDDAFDEMVSFIGINHNRWHSFGLCMAKGLA
jgi:hypothetical protein